MERVTAGIKDRADVATDLTVLARDVTALVTEAGRTFSAALATGAATALATEVTLLIALLMILGHLLFSVA